MKVLHLGLGGPEIDKALTLQGHEVLRMNWRGLTNSKLLRLTPDVLRAAKQFKPDLVFMQIQTPGIVERPLIEGLRDLGCFVLNWSGDVRENIDWYLKLAPYFSVTCFTNQVDIDKIREIGASADYLQIGYDPDIYYLDTALMNKRSEGVVFLGNNYGSRFPESERRYNQVKYYAEKKGLKVYGGNWHSFGYGRTHPHKERLIYNTNRYALNWDHFDRPLFYSDRVIRAQACGAILCQMGETDIRDEHPLSVEGYPGHWIEGDTTREQVARYTFENHRWEVRIPRIIEIMETHG